LNQFHFELETIELRQFERNYETQEMNGAYPVIWIIWDDTGTYLMQIALRLFLDPLNEDRDVNRTDTDPSQCIALRVEIVL
jgi:hypothetical protein